MTALSKKICNVGMIMLTEAEAKAICDRLEHDASWDKTGTAYYTLKRQLRELQK